MDVQTHLFGFLHLSYIFTYLLYPSSKLQWFRIALERTISISPQMCRAFDSTVSRDLFTRWSVTTSFWHQTCCISLLFSSSKLATFQVFFILYFTFVLTFIIGIWTSSYPTSPSISSLTFPLSTTLLFMVVPWFWNLNLAFFHQYGTN